MDRVLDIHISTAGDESHKMVRVNHFRKAASKEKLSWLLSAFALLVESLLSISHIHAAEDLQALSLEQLIETEVTSASGSGQLLEETAGAMFVISAEDIRRSGVTSVAEALRMVPGIHVARIDDTRWAVSARGFNDQLANKLAVMMDGRHIYTPDFAGVFWSDHMPLIDNVERIEVIRGPGASVWGSNAVNGVINIISRSARETQGLFLQARGGNRDLAGVTARIGGVSQSGWFYRADFHSVKENITDSPLDIPNHDFLEHRRASFRADGSLKDKQALTVEGSYYIGDSREVVQVLDFDTPAPQLALLDRAVKSRGGWLMSNWNYEDSETSNWQVSGYLENKSRDSSLGKFSQSTVSLQLLRRKLYAENHQLSWGFSSRFIDLPFEERSSLLQDLPGYESDNHITVFFAQDEIRVSETVALTLGSKFEKTSFVDWQVQPSVRLSWKLHENLSFWASASRAVRTPSTVERGLQIQPTVLVDPFTEVNPGPLPIHVKYDGDKRFKEEELDALEFGFKGKLGPKFNYDLAFFEFRYEQLLNGQIDGVYCKPENLNILEFANLGCLFSSDYLVAQTSITNDASGSSQGAELSFDWQVLSNWRLQGSFSRFDYSLFDTENPLSPGADSNPLLEQLAEAEPEKIGYLRSEWTINSKLELDLTLRAVGRSDVYDIDSYTTADLRLEWKPSADFRFELIGQNLLGKGHIEYGSRLLDALPSAVHSAVLIRLTWAP